MIIIIPDKKYFRTARYNIHCITIRAKTKVAQQAIPNKQMQNQSSLE
ncbi:MAG: hypothetical protein IJD52_00850 [Alphaproteobacteria bacterium]|nr:hypothetical protein [Alphaproteobacteria bacterium]